MKTQTTLTILVLAVLLSGCAPTMQPELTPLEKREIQSRSYPQSKEVVFRSVIAVLQDHGYTIRDADIETGHLVAESSRESGYVLFVGNVAKQTRATAFVERIGDHTTVRMSFVDSAQVFGDYGQTNATDAQIWDPESYQKFFEALETAIFMRS